MDHELAARQWGHYDRELFDGSLHVMHVIPLDDIKEHEFSGECWCGPERTTVEQVTWWGVEIVLGIQWVHDSLDGREEVQG